MKQKDTDILMHLFHGIGLFPSSVHLVTFNSSRKFSSGQVLAEIMKPQVFFL